jgi:hypothetical protein
MGPGKYLLCWFFPVPYPRSYGGFHWEKHKPKEKTVIVSEQNENIEEVV